MTDTDRPEIRTSTAEMLERTRRRVEQVRRRRRAAVAAIAAAVIAVAISLPVALVNDNHARTVKVVNGPPTTLSPTTPPPTTAPPTTPPPTTSPAANRVTPKTLPPPSKPTTPSAAPTTTTAAVIACATNHLSAHLANASGAAGSVGYDLTFVNTGTVTCSLTGYPGVSYVTADNGATVGAPARRDNPGPVGTTVLAPGQAARATLIETDALNYPQDTCQLTSVGGLRVYPPNQTAAVFVAQSAQACTNPADPVLQIGPVQSS